MGTKLYKEPREKKHEDFGKKLKEARKLKYKYQQEFADAIGAKVETVRNWEQGWILPEMGTLFKICDILDCDLDYLIGRLEHKTHDVQFIQDYTGLSEKSIKMLHDYHVSKTDGQNCLPTYISNILDHPDCYVLLHHIKTYIGASFLSGVLGDNTDIVDAEERRSANLWRISNKLTHIIEDLGREHYNKFGSERSHERSKK